MKNSISKFVIDAITPSKSRKGGANISCTEVKKDELLGDMCGVEFVLQTNNIPDAKLVGQTLERPVNLEVVDYDFTSEEGEQHAHYIKGYL